MNRAFRLFSVLGLLALLFIALPSALAAPPAGVSRACGDAPRGFARCFALVRTDTASGGVSPAALPSGYGPSDLRSAYNLTSSGSSSQTVAIVDAYDDPNAESDLAVYRS